MNMPVQIQCTSVIIRNDALDRCLEGGAAAFSEIAPNAMSYGDDKLSQASFMSSVDAEEFARHLELRGLDRNGEKPDFTIVDVAEKLMKPVCDWLILFEYDGRTIATLRGSPSRTVIAPEHDGHETVRQYSAEQIERDFEFVERKDDIDVYREKATGTLVYHARQTESPREVFEAAARTVWKYRRHPGEPRRSEEARELLLEAVEKLQFLSAQFPDSSDLAFNMGLAWFALGNIKNADHWFSRAAQLAPTQIAILKEWAGACLTEGEIESAVRVAQKAVSCVPDDSESLANLAVIQLVRGLAAEAQIAIARAVELRGDDATNARIHSIVADVVSGKRPCPKSLEEVMRAPTLVKRLKEGVTRWIGL